jgi:hydrogenase expression/formation protein HypE
MRTVGMVHGAGGSEHAALLERVILPALGVAPEHAWLDGAVLGPEAGELVLSTDGFVVRPLVFPGGSIGDLAFCGTVNDLAMMGARPRWLTVSLVIEAGLPVATLRAVLGDLGALARAHGVPVVAGDTKVVERGSADGLFITTTGLGAIPPGRAAPRPGRIAAGDAVLISGALGDHGAAVLRARAEPGLELPVTSDVAPLHGLVEALFTATPEVHALRDPTRGGVAEACNELAAAAGAAFALEEQALPVRPAVRAACELLGLDPLELANEGKLLAFVPAEAADAALAALRGHPLGAEAAIIGRVEAAPLPLVWLRTRIGGRRVVARPVGEQLPRIC